jgi:hypothetical protein
MAAFGAYTLSARSGRQRSSHSALSAPAAAGRACSVTSWHSYVPFSSQRSSIHGLPAEPPSSTPAATSKAATPAPPKASAEPSHRSWPDRCVRCRIAVGSYHSGTGHGSVHRRKRHKAKEAACHGVQVTWEGEPSTVPSSSARHRPQSRRFRSISAWHRSTPSGQKRHQQIPQAPSAILAATECLPR